MALKTSPTGPLNELTPRELEVLALIAQGKRNAEIASLLGIADSTTITHVHNVLQKLDVESRTQAAAYAWANGLSHQNV